MKKNKKQKMQRIFIMVAALFLILLAIIILAEGKSHDKNNDLGQSEASNEEKPTNEEKSANNEEVPNDDEETPAENENETSNDQEPEENEQQEEIADISDNTVEGEIIADPKAYEALVNKTNNLPDSYVPDDLVSLSDVPTVLENPEVNQLRESAYLALKDLFSAAKNEAEYELFARSGYRSYNTQTALYKSYVTNYGQAAADKYSAKPGQSEHQTGLAMDITCAALNFQLDVTFADTEEGKWVSENAHRFGFIVRYPKDKEDITGYFYEPWHIRYLGIELATKVYESGLTLEEYLEQ